MLITSGNLVLAVPAQLPSSLTQAGNIKVFDCTIAAFQSNSTAHSNNDEEFYRPFIHNFNGPINAQQTENTSQSNFIKLPAKAAINQGWSGILCEKFYVEFMTG